MNDKFQIQMPAKLMLAGVFSLGATQAQAEISANVSLVSDYVFRGISQSLEDPAIQGGFDWSSESGFYAGTWASNVDFAPAGGIDDGADLEWDLYFGFAGTINDSWSYDASLIQYSYPGTAAGVNYDYLEGLVSLSYSELLNLTLGYSSDVFNSNETGIYYEAATGQDIGDSNWSWNAALGYYDLNDLNSSYTNYSVGVNRAFEKLSLGLTLHNTDGEDEFGDIAGFRAVLSLSAEL